MNIIKTIKVADYITLLNAASGFLSIYFAYVGNFSMSALFMVFAFIFDAIDGKVARLTKSSSPLGFDLDSLADSISFGVAPAFFVVAWTGSYLSIIAGILLVCCGILRLARFNVTRLDGLYEGLPITWNGLIIPLLFFIYAHLINKSLQSYILPFFPIVLLISSLFMISSIQIRKII